MLSGLTTSLSCLPSVRGVSSFSRTSSTVLSSCLLASLPLGLAPAKLMNGYMVLTNGGSQPRSSPSLSSRTFSRPAGDILVNVDAEHLVRKMDTVVKLDAVRISFEFACLLISIVRRAHMCQLEHCLCPVLFTCLVCAGPTCIIRCVY